MVTSPSSGLRPGVQELVVLLISRREVETGNLDAVLACLKVFLASCEDAWRYRGQMTLVVDGYKDDPRELVEISEVRSLLWKLEARWPHWAYFFNQVDDSITLLMSCVVGIKFLGRGEVEIDRRLVLDALSLAFDGINAVIDRVGFPEDELEWTSKGLAEVLQQAGMA